MLWIRTQGRRLVGANKSTELLQPPLQYFIFRYTKRAPQNSFIHVDDFSSPKELAQYLRYLNSNDTAYQQYLEWKLDHTNVCPDLRCDLCSMIHDAFGELRIKNYRSLAQWSLRAPKVHSLNPIIVIYINKTLIGILRYGPNSVFCPFQFTFTNIAEN